MGLSDDTEGQARLAVYARANYVDRAKLSPARTFKSPMEVVQANDFEPAEKLAILTAWEVDERALLRAEDEGMAGGENAHLRKVCKRPWAISSRSPVRADLCLD